MSLTARSVNNNRVAIINLSVEVADTEKLNKLIKAIRKVDSVYDVHRQKYYIRLIYMSPYTKYSITALEAR